jgi:hypothetical protein
MVNSQKTRHLTRMFHHSSRSSIPIEFTCVQYTVCIHTQGDIWMQETEISDHKFPFCLSAPHVWRYDVASCTAHTFTGVVSLCWTWRQWRYIRWALYRWIWLTFWTFVIQRCYIYWYFHVNLSLNNLCLLKEENTPVAMNTNSFPEIVNFPWCLNCCFWYTVVLQDVAR